MGVFAEKINYSIAVVLTGSFEGNIIVFVFDVKILIESKKYLNHESWILIGKPVEESIAYFGGLGKRKGRFEIKIIIRIYFL